jgi:hypothetical protein
MKTKIPLHQLPKCIDKDRHLYQFQDGSIYQATFKLKHIFDGKDYVAHWVFDCLKRISPRRHIARKKRKEAYEKAHNGTGTSVTLH